jgi:hypothetical protein
MRPYVRPALDKVSPTIWLAIKVDKATMDPFSLSAILLTGLPLALQTHQADCCEQPQVSH